MTEQPCWSAYPEAYGTCSRESVVAVWRGGQVALGCQRCMVILGEFMPTVSLAQPDTLGEWRDSGEIVRRAGLGS